MQRHERSKVLLHRTRIIKKKAMALGEEEGNWLSKASFDFSIDNGSKKYHRAKENAQWMQEVRELVG